jgi:hypothetical protein
MMAPRQSTSDWFVYGVERLVKQESGMIGRSSEAEKPLVQLRTPDHAWLLPDSQGWSASQEQFVYQPRYLSSSLIPDNSGVVIKLVKEWKALHQYHEITILYSLVEEKSVTLSPHIVLNVILKFQLFISQQISFVFIPSCQTETFLEVVSEKWNHST